MTLSPRAGCAGLQPLPPQLPLTGASPIVTCGLRGLYGTRRVQGQVGVIVAALRVAHSMGQVDVLVWVDQWVAEVR